jgi:outer membrane protein, heavy metal efflux system
VELLRSRLAALQFENSVRQAELRQRSALTRLQVLLGRPRLSPAIEITGDLRHDATVPSLDEAHRAAAELRPDLRALERDVARSRIELRSQLAQGKVDYVLGAEYRRQEVTARSNSLGFSLSFALPVFNRNQGEIERARQEQRQAELKLRAQQLSIAGEVDAAYQQFETARGLLQNIETRMLQQARDVRQITEYSYRRGEASLLELLDAQRAFNETMQGYNEARAEYARSLYLLDSASGKAIN